MPILQILQSLRKNRKKGFAMLLDPDKPPGNLAAIEGKLKPEFLLIGGSLLVQNETGMLVDALRKKTELPLVLFPGNSFQLTDKADAILFLSLISGRNAELLIGQQVITAPFLKKSGMEIVSTGYILIDSGRMTTAHYMSGTLPIPADKPEIAAATALAGEMLGMNIIYMDAGSGAENAVPAEMIAAVREAVDLPLIVGGGMRSAKQVLDALKAGADLVVIGTAFEKAGGDLFLSELAESSIFKRENVPQ